MEKTIRLKSIVVGLLVALITFIIVDVTPFLFLWAGLSSQRYDTQLALQKWAVKTSVFRFQKVYTRNSILPLLVLSGDYTTAISYFDDLEALGSADNFNTKLAIFSYIKIGEFDKALSYAILINDKSRMAQIYIKQKDYAKANIMVESLMLDNPVKISTYVYKSEMLYDGGKYNEANSYIDKALNISPTYIDALYLKSRIMGKLGNSVESKKCFNQAKYLDSIKESMIR